MREKLKGLLPVGLLVLGISGVLKLVEFLSLKTDFVVQENVVVAAAPIAEKSADLFMNSALTEIVAEVPSKPHIALWFLIGGVVTLIVYGLYLWIKEKV